jgi:hypothetical protein
MKPIYVFLIALGTGILGFLAGGGLGLFGGGVAGAIAGAAGGMCVLVDTAVAEKVLTEAEVEKLGSQIGQKFRQKQGNPEITETNSSQLTITSSSPICEKFLNNVKQGVRGQ